MSDLETGTKDLNNGVDGAEVVDDSKNVAGTEGNMSGGKSKKACKKGGKKSRKVNSAAKSWVKFVVEVFKKNRAKNPSYKYKQAMKDAAKLKKKNKSLKM